MWLGASAASSPGSARLVVLTLSAPPLCPPSPPPLRAPSHDQQRRLSSGGGALGLRPACQDGPRPCLRSAVPHLSTPLTLPAPPPAPRPPPRRTQAAFRPKTTICWPWRGRGRCMRQVVCLRQPGLPSPPSPPCSSCFALRPRALRCRATACRPQGHPVLCGSPWPRLRADWYLAAPRGLAVVSSWLTPS